MKKLLTFLICLPLFTFSQSITDSLLLYYNMNGDAQDLSGNNFHGTTSGVNPVQDRYGNDSSAFYFDGVNDYIDFPLNDTLKPDFPMTFAFWVRLKELGGFSSQFFNTDFVQDNYHGVWMNVDGNGYLGIGFGGGLGGCNAQNRISHRTYEPPLDTGIWYHFTGIIKTASDIELYVNCNYLPTAITNGTGIPNVAYSTTEAGILGRMDFQVGNPAAHFWGTMDEFSYWKRALTSIEVFSLCDSMPMITASWNCIGKSCVNPGNGTGTYSNLNDCQTACNSTSITDVSNKVRTLIKITDVLGREESNSKKNIILFFIYDDGSVEKKIIIE
jgi:hypothetical protein